MTFRRWLFLRRGRDCTTFAPWLWVGRFLPVLLTLALLAQEQHATDSLIAIESLIRAHQYDQALELTNSELKKSPKDYHL